MSWTDAAVIGEFPFAQLWNPCMLLVPTGRSAIERFIAHHMWCLILKLWALASSTIISLVQILSMVPVVVRHGVVQGPGTGVPIGAEVHHGLITVQERLCGAGVLDSVSLISSAV